MCDASGETRNWRLYVKDMIQFAERVLSYTEGLDIASFVADNRVYDATLRNIELIGEAAGRLPQDVREAYPQIPWRRIIATRNRVAHGYLGIDDDVIWDIVQFEVPELLSQLRHLLKSAKEE